MSLDELMKAVDRLTGEELRQLREHIDYRRRTHKFTPEERIQMLEEAADAIREGLTQKELDEMIAVMNEEYIEPFDEAEWRE